MSVICFCMKDTYSFDKLVEKVAIQVGLDTDVPEDLSKASELANWMIGEGYPHIVLTHTTEHAVKGGFTLEYIVPLIALILGAFITFFCTTGCTNTAFTLHGQQGGQISYSVDENGNIIISGTPPVVQDFKK